LEVRTACVNNIFSKFFCECHMEKVTLVIDAECRSRVVPDNRDQGAVSKHGLIRKKSSGDR